MVRRAGVVVALLAAASCGGSSSGSGLAGASADAGVLPNGVVAIALSQTDVHIPVGVMTAFAVTATYADGTRGDVTQMVQLASSDTSVATVAHGQGAQAQITGVAPGSATVTVTLGSLVRTCAVTVTR